MKKILYGVLVISNLLSASPFEATINGSKVEDLSKSYGGTFGYNYNDTFRLKVGVNKLTYNASPSFGTMKFTQEIEQKNLSLLLDWTPFKEIGFFSSVGIFNLHSDNKLNATVDTTRNYTLNNKLYSGADLGVLSGEVDNKDFVPYLGVGYRYEIANKWILQAEAGKVFGLSPTMSLTTTNPNSRPTLQEDINVLAKQEESKLVDSYIITGISIGYRF